MKLLLSIAVSVLFIPIANAAITQVQSKSANTGNATATSLTITLDAPATLGNTILVAVAGGGAVRCKFGSINTEGLSAMRTNGVTVQLIKIHVEEASSTIVLTFGNNVGESAVAVEYNGTLIASDIPPLSNTGTSTTNGTGTTGTTDYANELIVAAMATRFATSSVLTGWLTGITNSFSSVLQTSTNINAATDSEVAFLEKIVTSTGTFSTAGTQTSAAWANIIATFTDNPTPTPTATATATNTPTPTATATASFTPCAPTPTATATATPSDTPTPTATATASFTPCSCPSTPTPTPSDTPTPTATVFYSGGRAG